MYFFIQINKIHENVAIQVTKLFQQYFIENKLKFQSKVKKTKTQDIKAHDELRKNREMSIFNIRGVYQY